MYRIVEAALTNVQSELMCAEQSEQLAHDVLNNLFCSCKRRSESNQVSMMAEVLARCCGVQVQSWGKQLSCSR